jgi:hypothetical protein
MINFYQWLSEQATATKPVPPSPRQPQQPQTNQQTATPQQPQSQNTPITQVNTLLMPCTKNIKSPECQTNFQQVNNIYKNSKNPKDKEYIKKIVTQLNTNANQNKNLDRKALIQKFTNDIGKLAMPCFQDLNKCDAVKQRLETIMKNKNQGKEAIDIISNKLKEIENNIQKQQQRQQQTNTNKNNLANYEKLASEYMKAPDKRQYLINAAQNAIQAKDYPLLEKIQKMIENHSKQNNDQNPNLQVQL